MQNTVLLIIYAALVAQPVLTYAACPPEVMLHTLGFQTVAPPYWSWPLAWPRAALVSRLRGPFPAASSRGVHDPATLTPGHQFH